MTQPSTATTLVIGEALIDVVHPRDGESVEHVGVSPLNVAVGLSRFGHPAVLATHIGEDERGHRIQRLLTDEGVELTVASFDLDATSTAQAHLDDDGAATYDFAIDWPAVTGLPTDVAHVHTGSIGASLTPGSASVFEALKAAHASATTSFDPNVRPSLMGSPDDERERVEQFCGYVDVIKSSDEDAQWLYPGSSVEEIAELWAGLGPRLVIITRGGDGAHVRLADSGTFEVAGRSVEVADTVGAGDSFMSGLISGLLDLGLLGGVEARQRLAHAREDDVRPALARAIATSSTTVTRAGSNPPTREEIAGL